MVERQDLCERCGAALGAGARFCESCGHSVSAGQSPMGAASSLPGPGGEISVTPPGRPATRTKRAKNGAKSNRRLGVFKRLAFLACGALLVVFGLRSPMLAIAGASANGMIYEVQERHARSDGRLRAEHWALYRFTANGQSVNGSYTLGTVYDVRNLPRSGTPIRVKYLAPWPEYNYPESQLALDWYGLGAMGVGALLLFAAVRRR